MESLRVKIGRGEVGTNQTVAAMRRYVRDAVRNPLTVNLASLIVEGAEGHRPTQVAAIRSYLESSTTFLRDPHGFELLRTVPEMLAMIRRRGIAQLDCDDVAVLGAALGKAVGLPARFVLLGFFELGAPFSHVYTELHDGRAWRDLDVTRYQQNLPAAVTRVRKVRI